jgi:hypothetical protein
MAKSAKKAAAAAPLSPAEMRLLERLVDQGTLVAQPQQANAKPRRVMAAALARDGVGSMRARALASFTLFAGAAGAVGGLSSGSGLSCSGMGMGLGISTMLIGGCGSGIGFAWQ